MKLSDGEKLIILMLNDLHRSNNVKSDFDPDFLDEAIRDNHLWSITWKYPGIEFNSQNDNTPPLVKEVLDYLEMWSFIEASYKRLSPEEIERLKQLAPVFGNKPLFEGFDGNNESEYLATATFIINKLDRFTEFSGRYLNSHSPSIDGYKRMLVVYKQEMENNNYSLLKADSLAKVLNERTHPSCRK
ncbi:YfbU family protein [Proteus mirabilis]|uniref:YfbU family protein n=1 Tax=Proteus mirabilis TaxID=584 RepID=UPI002B31622F|nr:YfbU family protein [Proteus mirabilis]